MIAAILVLLALASLVLIPPPPSQQRPNVVVCIFDDVSEPDIDTIATPTFDMLAAGGVRFRRAYSAPVCSAARMQFHRGTFSGVSSGGGCTGYDETTAPPLDGKSLPAMLKRAGYEVALFGKWHLGGWPGQPPWETSPQQHGYDKWRAGVAFNVNFPCPGGPQSGTYTNWLRVDDGVSAVSTVHQTIAVRDAALAWIGTAPEPWCAVLAFQAAHKPWGAGQPRQKYEGLLTQADAALGAVLAATNDPLVVVVGDNGAPDEVAPIPGKAKFTTFEGGIRVPMVWSGPGVGLGETHELASMADVLPTLADLLACGVPGGDAAGRSLEQLLVDPTGTGPRTYVWAGSDSQGDHAVVTTQWKYREAPAPELYDLTVDPTETQNLAGTSPELETYLAMLVERHRN